MDDFSRFRSHFPVLGQYTYLNTAAWGLLHDDLLEWRMEHDLDYLVGGSRMKIGALSILARTRQHLGRFFECPPGRVSLVPNFSLGLNLLLEGLPKGNRVVTLEGDYPSLTWPFESRGFEVEEVAPGSGLEARLIETLSESRADVLAVSLVQWVDGLLLTPDFLKSLKEHFPGLLIVADATQYAGAFLLNFEASGIDVLGASGYKWLLGGNGNGFMLFSEAAQGRFSIPATGFNSVEADLSKKEAVLFSKRLEPGHLDTLNFGSLDFSLGLLESLGMEAIDAFNRGQSDTIKRELGHLGLLPPHIAERGRHSTIFNIPEPGGLYAHLKAHDIICSPRGGGIRLSFHCYNTDNDLDKLLEVLKKAPRSL
jgi:selenocysteine lyase/cysteine desulfurase